MRTTVMIKLALAAGCLCSSARAEEAPSFPELLRRAEQSAPRLLEGEASVSAAQGHARQAAAWPNPALNLELEDFAGSGAYDGTSRAQTTVSLAEPLELGGQRSARIAVGRAELATAQARRAQTRADFGYDLALAYAAAEAAQQRVALLSEDLSRTQEDLRSAQALVDAGREGELRAVQAQAAVSAATAELEAARADNVATLARLSSLVGVSEPYTDIAPSLLISAGSSAPAAALEAPMVATAQAERDTAERRLNVERKRAIPTPSLSVGVRRLAGEDATAWVAGISIPMPLFDRNRGDIAAARAEVTGAAARLRAAQLDADAEWRAATAQASAARIRVTASDQGEASAREAYRLARIGYEAGRTPLFELLSTRRALTEAQLRSLESRLARVSADAALARLSGRMPFVD